MDALENVFVGEVLILHSHESGDCQEPDDRHSERPRVGSELLQSADDFQSEHSRVSSELRCCTFQGAVASSQGGLSSFSHRYLCQSSIERCRRGLVFQAAPAWSQSRQGAYGGSSPQAMVPNGAFIRAMNLRFLTQYIQRKLKRKRDSSHAYFIKICLHEYAQHAHDREVPT